MFGSLVGARLVSWVWQDKPWRPEAECPPTRRPDVDPGRLPGSSPTFRSIVRQGAALSRGAVRECPYAAE